jgi:hypothetical protein
VKRTNNGHRRRLPREAMLTRDAQVWAQKQRGMTTAEIAADLGVPRQTVDRSLARSEKVHANDDPLQHLQACLANPGTGTGEPDDIADPAPDWVVGTEARTAWLAARWDAWAAGLTVEDVERIAQTPNPALLLYRLRSHAPELPAAGVRRAINVAFKALPSGAPEDDEYDAVPWRVGAAEAVAKSMGTYVPPPPTADTF